MKETKLLAAMAIFVIVFEPVFSQQGRMWTEHDRNYLIHNLIESRDSLIKETSNLSKDAWQFKESPDRWSINEVVEHIAIWELLLAREVSMSLLAGPQPELNKSAKPDSIVLSFIMEAKPHISIEYTKPFTFTLPLGLNALESNLAWFQKMRDESISYVRRAREDLRTYYLKPGRSNIHQTYITTFGHTYRHLLQIQKIKQHPDYPGKKKS